MKKISIKCDDNGYAILTTSDIVVDNENKATEIEIDYSSTQYSESPKWVDIILQNGTSYRYDLGDEPIVTLEMDSRLTLKGFITITPIVYDGTKKIKYKTNKKVEIYYQEEAGSQEAIERDDFIFQLKDQVDTWDVQWNLIAQLNEGESISALDVESYPFVLFQVYDATNQRFTSMTMKTRSDLANQNMITQVRINPLRYAKIEKANDAYNFSVINELEEEVLIGSVVDVYGLYLRRKYHD